MGLPRLSVDRPITISMFFLGIILIGAISLNRLPIELLPNFSFGDISIFINIRGGIPPEEVEEQVSKLVEEAVGTVSHLKDLISISEEGRSRVVMRFEPGINMDYAILEVREKFARIRNKLPKQIEKPVIAKFEQEDVPILILAVTGLGHTPEMLRKIVDDEIKDRILRVNGVANIDIGGGRERKILVEVDQRK
ncbi:MAG: efflux RND transporter permease subunit, partial [Candidatus Omnitrophota bacterium]